MNRKGISRRETLVGAGLISTAPIPAIAQPRATGSMAAGGFDDFWFRYLDGKFGKGATPGWAMALAKDGQVLAQASSGYSDVGAQRPMTARSRLQIASASKPITAVALLKALESRGLDETVTIGPYLAPQFPGISPDVAGLTVKEVLTHRTGLPFGYAHSPRLETLRPHLERPLPPPADRSYVYSNLNYSIARTVLESLTGRSYADEVLTEVLQPAGAPGARLDVPAGYEVAVTYRLDDQDTGQPFREDFRDAAGAYGWYMNAAEMALFASAVADGPLLSQPLRRRIRASEMGWIRRPTGLGAAFIHDGQWAIEGAGVHTGIAVLPGGWGGAVVANSNGGFSMSDMLVEGMLASWPEIESQISRRSPNAFVRIETPAAADAVHYTLDGTDPGARSPAYESLLQLPGNTRVRTVAFAAGRPISGIAEELIEGPPTG